MAVQFASYSRSQQTFFEMHRPSSHWSFPSHGASPVQRVISILALKKKLLFHFITAVFLRLVDSVGAVRQTVALEPLVDARLRRAHEHVFPARAFLCQFRKLTCATNNVYYLSNKTDTYLAVLLCQLTAAVAAIFHRGQYTCTCRCRIPEVLRLSAAACWDRLVCLIFACESCFNLSN